MAFQRPVEAGRPSALLSRTITQPEATGPRNGTGAIGRLTTLSAAEAWPSGAAPLARWLQANPDVVGELIGQPLEAAAEEVPGLEAAVFRTADGLRLLAVVELAASSEATLGSLLTHLSAARAAIAVWICGVPRDEHVAALSWLNRAVDGRFYLARLRAARIGASEPAPLLDLVLHPPRAGDRAAADDNSPTHGPVGEARRAGDGREFPLPE